MLHVQSKPLNVYKSPDRPIDENNYPIKSKYFAKYVVKAVQEDFHRHTSFDFVIRRDE